MKKPIFVFFLFVSRNFWNYLCLDCQQLLDPGSSIYRWLGLKRSTSGDPVGNDAWLISNNESNFRIELTTRNISWTLLLGRLDFDVHPLSTNPTSSVYRVFHKKTSASYFHHFSLKCWPILIIISLLHSHMNCRKGWNKIYHITSNLLPHYLAKIKCSIADLFIHISENNVHNKR